MDVQSNRHTYPDPDSYGYGYTNGNSYSHSYSYTYSHSYRHADGNPKPDSDGYATTYADTKEWPFAKSASDTAAETLNHSDRLLQRSVSYHDFVQVIAKRI